MNSPSIAVWMPDSGGWSDIDPADPFSHALGGRETAAIRLAQELGKIGWHVTIYCPLVKGTDGTIRVDRRVTWRDSTRNVSFVKDVKRHDVLVSFESPAIFTEARCRLNILQYQCATPRPHDPLGKRDALIDHYFLLSHYQRWTLRNADPMIDADKCVVFGNGVDLERYDRIPRDPIPGRLVWSSSPDRGLHHLLRWWPSLRAVRPDLTLQVFYRLGFIDYHRWGMNVPSDWARIVDQGRNLPGVEYLGPVDQTTLARAQRQAEMFVYPLDADQPTETFMITALEIGAAGVPMLLSDSDCLSEVYGGAAHFLPLPIDDAAWIATILRLLDNPAEREQYLPAGRQLAERYTWQNIASRWDRFLKERLDLNDTGQINDLIDETEGLIPIGMV